MGPLPDKMNGPGDEPDANLTSDQRWSELLKARDKVQELLKRDTAAGNQDGIDKWSLVSSQLDTKARQMSMREPPQNQHLAQYLINRGLMQDPADQEEPTPRDASGASHFGPDESVREAITELKTSTYASYGKKSKAAQAKKPGIWSPTKNISIGRKSAFDKDARRTKGQKNAKELGAKKGKKEHDDKVKADKAKRTTWKTAGGRTAHRDSDGKITYTDK